MPAYRIDPTPNPDSLKFSSITAPFIEAGLAAFGSRAEAADDPLASELFAIDGVADILVLPTFLTITKRPDSDWNAMLPKIEQILNRFLE